VETNTAEAKQDLTMKTRTHGILIALAILATLHLQLSNTFAQDTRHLFVAESGNGNIHEFAPGGAQGIFARGTGRLYALAFDTAGNLFAANFDGGIYEATPAGSVSVFANLYNEPCSLVFDGASNLLVGVFGNGYIFQYTPAGSQSVNQVLSYSGRPVGLAFDSAGHLFISDEYNGYLYRSGSIFVSGLNDPWGIAFDSKGNLFEADGGSGRIYKFANVGGTVSSTHTTFASGLGEPFGLVFDSADNLFVSDYTAGNIYQFATNGSRTTFATGLIAPTALAFGTASVPRAVFSATPTNGTALLTVQFTPPNTDNLGNTLTAWHWDFGDGSTSTAQTPSHTYTSGGPFLSHLAATNSNAQEVFGAGPLIIVSLPTVAFAANPSNGTAPLTVQFTSPVTDSSGRAITNWHWDFGDSSTSIVQNPSHVYATPGTFRPGLAATNDEGVAVIGSGPSISAVADFGLVQNGGFETGDFSSWTTGGNFTHCYVNQPYAHSGTYGAELYPYSTPGLLSQTLATTPGANYVISFWLENQADPQNEFFVSWNGNTNFDQADIGDIGWTNIQLTVTATGPSTVLQFGFWNNTSSFGLDDISVKVAAPPQPRIDSLSLSGANLVINGSNGQSGGNYIMLSSTNLALPFSQWTPVATNTLVASGNFTFTATNVVAPILPQRFFVIKLGP
jgi:PKD repeat protein